jgi:hypothetical protein
METWEVTEQRWWVSVHHGQNSFRTPVTSALRIHPWLQPCTLHLSLTQSCCNGSHATFLPVCFSSCSGLLRVTPHPRCSPPGTCGQSSAEHLSVSLRTLPQSSCVTLYCLLLLMSHTVATCLAPFLPLRGLPRTSLHLPPGTVEALSWDDDVSDLTLSSLYPAMAHQGFSMSDSPWFIPQRG